MQRLCRLYPRVANGACFQISPAFATADPEVYNPGMDTPQPKTWKYLAPKLNSSYKQLFVKGRNIRARTLYGRFMSEEEPMTVEEIAADYDLPVQVVQEAIAYCQTNPPEIEEDFRADEKLMEATGMNDPNYKFHGKPKMLSPQEVAAILDRP
jgi:uncharacterized protein (DUF433 family)